jgi:HD superfamily phosphohydrolase YqeK
MHSRSGTGTHSLHPLLAEASRGVLPPWTRAREKRREHMARVAALMGEWAGARGESGQEVSRWRAAGLLHDALRDEDPEALRAVVAQHFKDLPGKVLHGPGVARRLEEEGVGDWEFVNAIAHHTLGSPAFGALGMALYAADFLEPGRSLREDWRRSLRERAPADLEGVVREILSARIRHLLEEERPLHWDTVAFWNRMAEGETWASASEV